MATKKVRKISEKTSRYTCITLRFADVEHHQLVRDAAAVSKLAMNSWLIRVTLEAAREELRRATAV
jgi:hypothetical protein